MNILILGASSQLGSELSRLLAPGNHLVLSGRNSASLEALQQNCIHVGASYCQTVSVDLGQEWGPLIHGLAEPLDLVVHVASATSRLRDDQLIWNQFAECIRADALHPLEYIEALLQWQAGHPLRVCLVSSFLADIQSPDRQVHGALKFLHEAGLKACFDAHPELTVRIFKIGRVFSKTTSSPLVIDLANELSQFIFQSGGWLETTVGFPGRFMRSLFYFQPHLFGMLIRIQRIVRGTRRSPLT
jgi:NADP-dependent 3-hydroxy acid dehydrogenase YdfG